MTTKWGLAGGLVIALVSCLAARAAIADTGGQRDIQSAVESYLRTGDDAAKLVGGPGCAGYDGGFWIRGGDFSLKINLTLQARYEFFDFDEDSQQEVFAENDTGGDLSGFSLPRATLKLGGTAPCDICWYMELEFGHFGRDALEGPGNVVTDEPGGGDFFESNPSLGALDQSLNFDNTREAWIEWCYCPSFNLRVGQVKLPGTRQLMVAPEMQQFVDISLASAFVGAIHPGYTDRNRDHGLLVHGSFGCSGEWSYMLAVTNGDGGDSIRNVLDVRTSDNLAFSGRLNWAFLKPIGYQEGALRQQTCSWYGEVGAWAFYYADRSDKPHEELTDSLRYGADLALGWGGFSMTAAVSWGSDGDTDGIPISIDYLAWLVQLGYHFPGTPWELAARYSTVEMDGEEGDVFEWKACEMAAVVSYYLNGHGNKLQLDVSVFGTTKDESFLLPDVYAGIPPVFIVGDADQFGVLIRFQWQLAL